MAGIGYEHPCSRHAGTPSPVCRSASSNAALPAGLPTFADRPVPSTNQPVSPYAVPTSTHTAPRKSLARQGAPAARNKAMFFVVPLLVILLAGAGAAYYLWKNRTSSGPNMTGQPPIAQATAEPNLSTPSQQPTTTSAPAPDTTQTATAPASRNQIAATGAPPTPAGTAEANPASQQGGRIQPGSSATAAGASPRKTAAAPKTSAASVSIAARTAPGGTAGTATQRAPQADVANLPQGFLIFCDAEESSEKLPLASAQSQVADIVRQAGYRVLRREPVHKV